MADPTETPELVERVARALAESHGLRFGAPRESLGPWMRDAETAVRECLAALSAQQQAPDTLPSTREQQLEDALRKLEAAASRVHRLGAVTGPQWFDLIGPLVCARALLTKESQPASHQPATEAE